MWVESAAESAGERATSRTLNNGLEQLGPDCACRSDGISRPLHTVQGCCSSDHSIRRFFAGENRGGVLGDYVGHELAVLFFCASDVWGEDAVVQGFQAFVDYWFFFEDVEACAPDSFFAEGIDQRGFLYDGTAGGVDEDGVGFHQAEFAGADHAAGLGGEGGVDADDVGLFEAFIEGDALGRERGEFEIYVLFTGDVDGFCAEADAADCGGEADSARADDAESAAGDVNAEEVVGAEGAVFGVVIAAGVAVGFDQAAGDGEKERPGEVGGAFGDGVGCVGDCNVSGFAGGEVDVVGSDGEIADGFKARTGGVEDFGIDLFRDPGDEDGGAFGELGELGPVHGGAGGEFDGGRGDIDLAGEGAADGDDWAGV